MTQYLAGPTVTRMMAEMGADIIKIEQAPSGDPSRNYAIINEKGRSGYFCPTEPRKEKPLHKF